MGDVIDLKPDGHSSDEGHGKCGAKTRSGGKCGRPKGWGTEHPGVGHCKFHGGSTPAGEKHAAKQTATIMGDALDMEPHEALLSCVRITAGEVAYCSAEIAELDRATESTMFGKKLDLWIEVRQGAIIRLAKFSKMALDAGVAERQVQIAERYGDLLATFIGGVFDDLKLTAKQREAAREIVPRRLRMLEQGG